jgi:membrane protein DedA with SNARE-associated domain
MQPHLPGVLNALAPVLTRYGYLAVFALVFVEGFGPPAPGQSIMIAAAVYAGAGRLNLVVIIVVGFVAAVSGDNVGFAIGHFGGRPLVARFGRRIFLTEERLATAERFVQRHGGKVVSVARFVDGLRQANGIVAGLAGMAWWRFLVFNAIGAVAWVGVWTSLGYLAGDHIGVIEREFTRYEKYVLIALGVAVIALVVHLVLRRRRKNRAHAVASAETNAETNTDTD